MSYSIRDAVIERQGCINHAIALNDYNALRAYANLYAEEGEDEAAERLLDLASIAYRNTTTHA